MPTADCRLATTKFQLFYPIDIFTACQYYGAPNGSKIVFGKGDTSSKIEILLAESEILF